MKKSKTKIDPTLADTIRDAMAASGLTNYRISKETGIAASILSRFVNGERSISIEIADKLCKLLDLKLVKSDEE